MMKKIKYNIYRDSYKGNGLTRKYIKRVDNLGLGGYFYAAIIVLYMIQAVALIVSFKESIVFAFIGSFILIEGLFLLSLIFPGYYFRYKRFITNTINLGYLNEKFDSIVEITWEDAFKQVMSDLEADLKKGVYVLGKTVFSSDYIIGAKNIGSAFFVPRNMIEGVQIYHSPAYRRTYVRFGFSYAYKEYIGERYTLKMMLINGEEVCTDLGVESKDEPGTLGDKVLINQKLGSLCNPKYNNRISMDNLKSCLDVLYDFNGIVIVIILAVVSLIIECLILFEAFISLVIWANVIALFIFGAVRVPGRIHYSRLRRNCKLAGTIRDAKDMKALDKEVSEELRRGAYRFPGILVTDSYIILADNRVNKFKPVIIPRSRIASAKYSYHDPKVTGDILTEAVKMSIILDDDRKYDVRLGREIKNTNITETSLKELDLR